MHGIDRNVMEGEYEFDAYESVFNEQEEMKLAFELLSVSSEAELDQFLGKLYRFLELLPKPFWVVLLAEQLVGNWLHLRVGFLVWNWKG